MDNKKLKSTMIIGGVAVFILMLITEVTGELVLITWVSIFVYLVFLGKNLSKRESQSKKSTGNASLRTAQTTDSTPVQPSCKVCPSCEKEYPLDALYCSDCGLRLAEKL